MTNTHNPACSQRGSLMVVTYLAPAMLTETSITSSLFSFKVRLFWPRNFNECRVVNKQFRTKEHSVVTTQPSAETASFTRSDGAVASKGTVLDRAVDVASSGG